jgi:CubicO group peptidase (beta-lactamase class C family)
MNRIIILLCLFISNKVISQNTTDIEKIKNTCLNYIEGFYEGDTSKLIRSLKPSLYKTGYWKNKKTGKYESEGLMLFGEAMKYAKDVFTKKEFPKSSSPKIVQVLDISNYTASAKVTAWWGTDYLLLSKDTENWIIEEVLWEGPLQNYVAPKSKFERIDSLLQDAYSKFPVGSISVGIVRHDTVIWKKSYGFADMENKTPATSTTLYRIGSISKQFTAMMMLKLEEDKKIQISEPIEKYLPEFKKVQSKNSINQPISFVQLATHLSGMAREPEHDSLYTIGKTYDWDKTLLSAFKDIKFRFEPGVRYSYSNIGYSVLGLALSKVAKKTYTEYIINNITKPLGMNHTFFSVPNENKFMLAKGYAVNGTVVDTSVSTREHSGRGFRVPNGGLYSTVDDMTSFIACLMNEGSKRILKPETVTENYKRLVVTNSRFSSAYGIGYIIEKSGSLNVFGHGGTVNGYDALLAYNLPQKVGIIFLHNATGDSFNSFDLSSKIFGILSEK